MADFNSPPGPPPPQVPEGWIVRWNEQYKEWFYVNQYTKVSQWNKPDAPAIPPPPTPADDGAPTGPPPSYSAGAGATATTLVDAKKNPYDNPANSTLGSPAVGSSSSAGPATTTSPGPEESDDAKLAARLQAEEDARARGGGPGAGGNPNYFGETPAQQGGAGSPFPQQLPPRSDSTAGKAKGLIGKLFGGKNKHGSSPFSMGGGSHGHYPPQQYGGYPQQQGMYGGGYPPQQGYGGYPPQQAMYGGGYPPQGGYGGYPGGHAPMGGGMFGRPGAHRGGGGMGMMGGAALGVGAGLLGGAIIADQIHDGQEDAYQQGFQDGAGNDDFGGGDFGGDF